MSSDSTRAMVLAAVAKHPSGITGVAADIGYSRSALSRYLGGSYPADQKIEAAIVSFFDRRMCPHLNREVGPDMCRRKALAPQPYGGRERLAHWQECQRCRHKPKVTS